jgi:hypothetical protein
VKLCGRELHIARLTLFHVHHPLFGGWLVSALLAAVDEPSLSSSKESVGAPKIMSHESTPLRVRALRVIDRQGGAYSRWIVLEDVDRAQFRVGSYIAFGDGPTKGMKGRMDRDDAWDVLNSLRNASRFPENALIHWPEGDSIDAAISHEQIKGQELQDWALHGKAPGWTPREHEPSDQISKPTIVTTQGGGPSEVELQQMIKEVWDFAGRKRLKWKPIGRTPAGRKCEVLTFNGSEEVLVGPTSVEVTTQSN